MTKNECTIIVTADDFGADVSVNDAVEAGHRDGILTAASLMVAAPAANDAAARAKTMPRLGVGLHLVLVEGRPTLPPERIPDLVGADGLFRTDMAVQGARMFFLPHVRRQLAAEIEAQFVAFAATGLPLDHVNAHKHYHLHPTIAALALSIGRRYGLRAMRTPFEPASSIRAIEPDATHAPLAGALTGAVAARYAARLGRRLKGQNIRTTDRTFGLAWSGAMTTDRVAALIERMPDGINEIYLHPALADRYPLSAPGYRYCDEAAALTAPQTGAALRARGAVLAKFGDL